MEKPPKKKRIALWIGIVLIGIIGVGLFVLYQSLDQIIKNELTNRFDASPAGDVYDLHFENLSLNLAMGSIKVYNVIIEPKKEARADFPYINSDVKLTTALLMLDHVDVFTLVFDKLLVVDQIIIIKPELAFNLNGPRNIFLPFPENNSDADTVKNDGIDDILDAFRLSGFKMAEASVSINDSFEQNEYQIEKVNIHFENLNIAFSQNAYKTRVGMIDILIGEGNGKLSEGFAKQVHFEDFIIKLDSAISTARADTFIYQFRDFKSSIRNLDVLTADSLQQITMEKFDLSYSDQSIRIASVNFEPNVTMAALQRRNQFQKVEASGSFKTLVFNQVNFDELIYHARLVVDSVVIDSAKANLYKDRNVPINTQRIQGYPPQSLAKIDFPVQIRKISATNSLIEHNEKLEDGTIANVHVYNAFFSLENISNISSDGKMVLHGKGDLENAARFDATLSFDYALPQFSFQISVAPFDLSKLNSLVNAFTPARLSSGYLDKLSFSGTAQHTYAEGTMEFLYHDLKMEIDLENQANWKSALLSFAGNTIVQSANPPSENSLARVVDFHIERDMNKAFLNVIIKSVLEGIKETLIMGKENRKAHQEKKKLAKD